MTTETATEPLTVDELAARAGVTVRTIRFYGTRGLLPPPALGPRRVGHYGPEHLSRLALIEELQHQGMTLAGIERYLEQLPADLGARDLAIHRALVACWTPESTERVSLEELRRRAGRDLGETEVERLLAMNIIRRAEEREMFHSDPAQLRLGVELLEVPIGNETILAARTVLMEHTRAVAHELARLFREEVWDAGREEGGPEEEHTRAMKSLSAHMQPLIVQAMLTAFQRSMREELRDWFTELP